MEKLSRSIRSPIGQLSECRTALAREKQSKRRCRKQLETILTAADIISDTAKEIQQRVHGAIAASVTKCLRAVYGEGYAFELEFKKSRGKTVCIPWIVKNGMRLEVKETSGGGLLDVISFALRATFLVMSHPQKRRLLVLDEPFRGVDADRIENVRGMILEMSRSLGIQFVIVSHNPALSIGKVIRI